MASVLTSQLWWLQHSVVEGILLNFCNESHLTENAALILSVFKWSNMLFIQVTRLYTADAMIPSQLQKFPNIFCKSPELPQRLSCWGLPGAAGLWLSQGFGWLVVVQTPRGWSSLHQARQQHMPAASLLVAPQLTRPQRALSGALHVPHVCLPIACLLVITFISDHLSSDPVLCWICLKLNQRTSFSMVTSSQDWNVFQGQNLTFL